MTSTRKHGRSASLDRAHSTRTIQIGQRYSVYGPNAVVTSKYTWYNLIPKALFEQFRRVSNVYFLIVAAISYIPNISPSSPITTTMPLVVVIGFGLARDVFEDFLRGRADTAANNCPVIIRPCPPSRYSQKSRSRSRSLSLSRSILEPDPPTSHAAARQFRPLPEALQSAIREVGLTPDDYRIVRCRDVTVGDVLLFMDDQQIPTDAVVLSAERPAAPCFVSTANLDGESNLKRRRPTLNSINLFDPFDAALDVAPPTPSLYQFQGKIYHSAKPAHVSHELEPDLADVSVGADDNHFTAPLDERNLLLRGSVLRNTPYVHAAAVYTGRDTKLALNMRPAASKLGGVERTMNRVVIALFIALLVITAITSTLAGVWQASRGKDQWYMGDNSDLSATTVGLRSIGTFIILYHTFVPVSLFVTLEFVRLVQGFFISWDTCMWSDEVGQGADVRANNLNETLGYIDHIFSDKTGTLTQNVMRFIAYATPDGAIRNALNHKPDVKATTGVADADPDVDTDPETLTSTERKPGRGGSYSSDATCKLATAMAIAHDVVPAHAHNNGEMAYEGESVDEVALVNGAVGLGATLQSRSDSHEEGSGNSNETSSTFITVRTGSQESRFRVDAMLEFNSDRKRMSVVARSDDGTARIICKGADTTMLPRLVREDERDLARRVADELSSQGLRTLIYAERVLSKSEFRQWIAEFRKASSALHDRDTLKAAAAAKIEKDFELIGVTGVEDKLQDDVPQAIEFLRQARVRVWMLTGDKVETAENIGHSTNLLNHGMHVTIAKCETESELGILLQDLIKAQGGTSDDWDASVKDEKELSGKSMDFGRYGLVIDGGTLGLVQGDRLEQLFVQAASGCGTVICARVTPLQKALVVKMVRQWSSEKITSLAVGDGGNDVSMIQQADVGVGIKGREGLQAARSADYAIVQFRHLIRLLAVHGRFSYVRTAGVINLSFYKNVMFSCTQFLFQFFCFATGTTVHDQWIVTMWNALLTLFPPFLYGIFERDLDIATVLRFPAVYASNRGGRALFGFKSIVEFPIIYGIWHALVFFWLTYWLFGETKRIAHVDGRDSGFYLVGLALSVMSVSAALFRFFLTSALCTWPVLVGLIGSFGLLWVLIVLFPIVFHELPLEGVLSRLMSSAGFHLLWPVAFTAAFLPDFAVKVFRAVRGSLVHRLRMYERR